MSLNLMWLLPKDRHIFIKLNRIDRFKRNERLGRNKGKRIAIHSIFIDDREIAILCYDL